jgi:hypothetical protein
MNRSWTIMLTIGVSLAILLLMTACTPASPFRVSGADGPQIKVIEPAPNTTTVKGSTVVVRASIQDSAGIVEALLRVNGEAAQTLNLSTPPVTELTQELFWTPELVGTYQIQVDARNRNDEWGHSQPMTVFVVDTLARETVIAVPSPTAVSGQAGSGLTPTSTPTPIPSGACIPIRPTGRPSCSDRAAFVADVTVPDGTVLAPGTAFDKTWRLRNTGTCTWNTGYQLAFVGGSQLSAPGTVNIPHDVSPGSTVDITVPMVAPQANGRYRSGWQMRNPDCCNLFGPIIYALIEVRSEGGDNRPFITRFEVVPNTISRGQQATLYWVYENGTSARIYPGNIAVGSTGSRSVAPNTTTTYRLVVTNDAGSVERTTTLVVQSGTIPPSPPATPANLAITGVYADGFDFTWVDTSSDEQDFRLYDASTGLAVAVFPANTTSGAIRGLTCGTSYSFYLVSFNERGESWPGNMVQNSTSPCNGS